MTDIQCRQCGHRSPIADHPMGAFRCSWCDWREVLHLPTRAECAASAKATAGISAEMSEAMVPTAQIAAGRPENMNGGHSIGGAIMENGSARSSEDSLIEAGPSQRKIGNCRTIKHESVAREFPDVAHRAFTLVCGRLFERFGYAVKVIDDNSLDRDCDLKITKHDQVTYVDCIAGGAGGAERASGSQGDGGMEFRAGAECVVPLARCQRLVGAMVGSQIQRGIIVTTGHFAPACAKWVNTLGSLRIDLIDGQELAATHEAMSAGPLSKWCE